MKIVWIIPVYVHVYYVWLGEHEPTNEFMRSYSEQLWNLIRSASKSLQLFRETSHIRT